MEWFYLISDFITKISWQLVLLVALFLFKNPLRKLLKRLKYINKKGIGFTDRKRSLIQLEKTEAPAFIERDKDLEQNNVTLPIVKDLIQILKTNFEQVYPKKNGSEKEDILFKELAETRYREQFERIYNQIFGSQLKCLLALRQYAECTLDEYYDDHIEKYKKIKDVVVPHLTFEQWLDFLRNNSLIEFKAGKAKILPIGDAFVEYISHKNYFIDKNF